MDGRRGLDHRDRHAGAIVGRRANEASLRMLRFPLSPAAPDAIRLTRRCSDTRFFVDLYFQFTG